MNAPQHIVFIESNPIGMRAITIAKKLGFRATFITCDLGYYLKGTPLNDHILSEVDSIISVHNSTDVNEILETLSLHYPTRDIDAVVSYNDLHTFTAAKVAEVLNLKNMNPESVLSAKNKFVCKNILTKNGLFNSDFRIASNYEEAEHAAHQIGYPIIVKPVDGTGGLYVRKINQKNELEEQINYLTSINDYGRGVQRSPQILVEEFLEGALYSAETCSINGEVHILGFTKRDLIGDSYFVEVGSLFPCDLGTHTSSVSKLIIDALTCLGLDFGFCHTEFILTNNGPVILEVNPRLAGGVIPKLIECTCGVDVIELSLMMFLGHSININLNKSNTFAYSYHFTSPELGILKQVSGWENILHHPAVKEASWTRLGRTAGLKSNFDRLGYMVVQGNSEDEVRSTSKRLCEQLTLTFESSHGGYPYEI